MNDIHLMITISDRDHLADIVSLYRETGIDVNFIMLAQGTATNDVLDVLGLDRSEKAVCMAVVTEDVWKEAKRGLERKIRIDVPGIGIAFIVPMSSIGGRRELAFLTDGLNFVKGGETEMRGTKRELLVIICNQGYNEIVMDAARGAGAAGGTVIHARGTGMQKAERFLGISLASEKDIIFIVTRTSQKNGIMEAIMKNAGAGTKAAAIVFSLPVSGTAGLRLLEEEDEEPAGDSPHAADVAENAAPQAQHN